MAILIACEESQTVCKAFRARGFEAYSCDVQPCSGGHPEWHIQGDVLPLLKDPWDLVIAHPPCTYLTTTGNRWFNIEKYGNAAIERARKREEAAEFFMEFTKANSKRIAIENPIGFMSTIYRKQNQIIHPNYFGDPERKSTCLWLFGLPKLFYREIITPEIVTYSSNGKTDSRWHMETLRLPPKERSRIRSKTFQGIAEAMAQQWGDVLLGKNYAPQAKIFEQLSF